jgi:hypothetical protein
LANPLFWLALSFLLVVISLTAVLMVAIPAMRELGRAARSAEKLFDTLGRELPPTLEAIRLTGLEITELTDDVTEGVQGASQVVQQVNHSLSTAHTGAKRLNTGTRSLWAGARAAWGSLTASTSGQPSPKRPPRPNPTVPPLASSSPTAPDHWLNPNTSQPLGEAPETIQLGTESDLRPDPPVAIREDNQHTQPEPWIEAEALSPEALAPGRSSAQDRRLSHDRD